MACRNFFLPFMWVFLFPMWVFMWVFEIQYYRKGGENMTEREELFRIISEHPEICKDLLAALEKMLAAKNA